MVDTPAARPVQSVDQVDGVGNQDNPQQRRRDGQGPQLPAPTVQGHQAAEKVDLIPAGHRHRGSGKLHHQLIPGGNVVNIIQSAQQYDDHCANEHTDVFGAQGRKEEHTEEKAQKNGQSSHPRRRRSVEMPGAGGSRLPGHVDGPHLQRQLLGQRRGQQRNRKGHQQGHCRGHPEQNESRR